MDGRMDGWIDRQVHMARFIYIGYIVIDVYIHTYMTLRYSTVQYITVHQVRLPYITYINKFM